jgi:hypothetical protein
MSTVNVDLKVELWPIGKLLPQAKNPRTHTKEQVKRIVESMKAFGWTNPILAGAGDELLAGHGRILAAHELELTEVPVIQLGHLSEAQRKALVIADNQLAINGASWNMELLASEIFDLKGLDFDIGLLGFDGAELDRILGTAPGDGSSGDSRTLSDRFGVPPFSVLDARQGYWQDRKRAWLALGIKSELGRGDCTPGGGGPNSVRNRPAGSIGEWGGAAH